MSKGRWVVVNFILLVICVMLIFTISAFILYMVFFPLARTIIGGLQIIGELADKRTKPPGGKNRELSRSQT